MPETDDRQVALVLGMIEGYRRNLVATIKTLDEMAAAIRQAHDIAFPTDPERGTRVRLSADYDQHIDNVGGARIGRWLSRGTGDWEGFVMVDFTESGGRKIRVPESAVRPA